MCPEKKNQNHNVFFVISSMKLAHYNRLVHKFRQISSLRRSRSFKVTILVPIESSYDFLLVINTNLPLSYTVSKLRLIIGQIFASERGVPGFNAFAGVTPANIAINDIPLKTRFFGLHYHCRKYWCIFNHLRNPPRKLPNSVKLHGR